VTLRGSQGLVRQGVLRGNGHKTPTFLITNDFDRPWAVLVGHQARRWGVEKGIAEAVKVFHLNAPSSPLPIQGHLEVAMPGIADPLHSMLAKQLRGLEPCNAPKLYRHFIQTTGVGGIRTTELTIPFPGRAHNPTLRAVPWHRLPSLLLGAPISPSGSTKGRPPTMLYLGDG
jgi:hypothetical protein